MRCGKITSVYKAHCQASELLHSLKAMSCNLHLSFMKQNWLQWRLLLLPGVVTTIVLCDYTRNWMKSMKRIAFFVTLWLVYGRMFCQANSVNRCQGSEGDLGRTWRCNLSANMLILSGLIALYIWALMQVCFYVYYLILYSFGKSSFFC